MAQYEDYRWFDPGSHAQLIGRDIKEMDGKYYYLNQEKEERT
jgi:hypothetical protein